jgi:hypothetical protein
MENITGLTSALEALIKYTNTVGNKINDQKIRDWRKNHSKGGKMETSLIEEWSGMKIGTEKLGEIFQKFLDEFDAPSNLQTMCLQYIQLPTTSTPQTPITPKRTTLASLNNTTDDTKVTPKPVDESRKFRDLYRKLKKLTSHKHVLELHLKCDTVPSSLACSRFPTCPFPHDENLVTHFERTIRGTQKALLDATLCHVDLKICSLELALDDENLICEDTRAALRKEIDLEMREATGKALDRAEGTLIRQEQRAQRPNRSGSFKRRRHNKEN